VSPVPVRADKRFRRAHVKPARPRRSWRAWTGFTIRIGLAVLVLAFLAYRFSGVVALAHVLQIDRIEVHGNERMSNGEVLAVLGGLRGRSLVWTDLNEWRTRLLASAWVRDADLRRSLPSTIEVVVIERQPIAIARIDRQLYLLDDHGVLIDEHGPQYAEFDLPIVDGLPRPADDRSITDPARADLAARVIAATQPRPEIARRLSQIDVANLHDAVVILSGDSVAVHLGDQQFLRRLQSYLELAPTLHEWVADIEYVDFRFDSRVYVRPTGRPGKPGIPVRKEKR
jgi:cell division septal protein FtsQ